MLVELLLSSPPMRRNGLVARFLVLMEVHSDRNSFNTCSGDSYNDGMRVLWRCIVIRGRNVQLVFADLNESEITLPTSRLL